MNTFDVVKFVDMRFPGGTSVALAHELRALSEAGVSVGLAQTNAPALGSNPNRPIHALIEAAIERGWARRIGPDDGETRASVAIFHNPMILMGGASEALAPRVRAERAVMVAHQAALARSGVPYYDIATAHRVARDLSGTPPIWAPISPASRADLEDAIGRQGASGIELSRLDWPNFLFVEEWAVPRDDPRSDRPVIGRHSRPDRAKWPDDRADLLAAYPSDPAFEVRFLGYGEIVDQLLAGPRPSNWRCASFGALDAASFLAEIDFFVYYHHPDWTEAFGRTIAEAIASGCVAILPPHFRDSFGEAAIYRPIEEVAATVRELWDDWPSFRCQSELGRRWIERRHGPSAYLRAFSEIAGPARSTLGANSDSASAPSGDRLEASPPPSAPANGAQVRRLDVVHLADMRSVRESAWRLWNSIMIESDAGYAVGLAHLPGRLRVDRPWINPHLERLRAEGRAVALEPGVDAAAARLAIVHRPESLLDREIAPRGAALPWISARKAVIVHDRSMAREAILETDHRFRLIFGGAPLEWWPTDAERAKELEALRGEIAVSREHWSLSIWVERWREPNPRPGGAPVIGRSGLTDASQWPEDPRARAAAYPDDGSAVVRIHGWPHAKAEALAASEGVERFDLAEAHPLDFLTSLDGFHYYASPNPTEPPFHAMAMAAAHGVPVFTERRLGAPLEGVASFANGADALARTRALLEEPERRRTFVAERARRARDRFGPSAHLGRLRRLTGAAPMRPAFQRRPSRRARPVLFLSSNGVGLGHLTRLLAIARRMPREFAPYFLTMSQATAIVEQAGFPCLFTPYHGAVGCDQSDWNRWLEVELDTVLDRLDPCAVVFDGGNPYAGLVRAVSPRAGLPLIWVRRGMWRESQDNAAAIERQKFFDLIIEPAEIAGEWDRGATCGQRARTLDVAPIRLLDDDEILDREAARRALGLDADAAACLIQLGAGSNRDIVSMTDMVLEKARERAGAQCMIAEWLIGRTQTNLWPDAPRLRGFPISKFFKAFDFTVSAAGYNSFNEIISMGLPAIFIANEHAMMDDQEGRARFAQANDAGFYLPENRADAIGSMIDALLDPPLRQLISANCRRLAMQNGAVDAARAIAALAREAA